MKELQAHFDSRITEFELQLLRKDAEVHRKNGDIAWFAEELSNTRLILQEKEAEILKFPRIEEKIRSDSEKYIRNSIIDMQRKDVQRNRQLEDLKELQYWKAAAAHLEEKLKKVTIKEENLRRQEVQRKQRESGSSVDRKGVRPSSAPSTSKILNHRRYIKINEYLKQFYLLTMYFIMKSYMLKLHQGDRRVLVIVHSLPLLRLSMLENHPLHQLGPRKEMKSTLEKSRSKSILKIIAMKWIFMIY